MALWNQHWYDLNSGREYPIDESATLLSDSGEMLPHGLIADVMLKLPEELGEFVFLSSITVTERLVTVTFQAASSPSATSEFVPVAVLSLLKPVDKFRVLPLSGQYPGVAGHIVFGTNIDNVELFNARFSSAAQSRVTPRAIRRYRTPPVRSLSVPYSQSKLTGLVKLTGQSPIEVVKETREIGDVVRDVIVIRLVQPQDQSTSIFEEFAGTCGGRPESRNCEGTAIEFVNNVAPNCDGVMKLEFHGSVGVARILETCGIMLLGQVGLGTTCVQKSNLPDQDGNLPNEYNDICNPVSDDGGSPDPDPGPGPGWPPSEISLSLSGALPYVETFDDCRADDFQLVSGSWKFVQDDSPEEPPPNPPLEESLCDMFYPSFASTCSDSLDYEAGSCPVSYSTETAFGASFVNITLWRAFDDQTIDRVYTTDLKLVPGPPGTKHNGGIVFNYKPHPTLRNRYTYFLAYLDYDSLTFQVSYFNGTTLSPLSSVDLPTVFRNFWYRIRVTVTPPIDLDPDQALIVANLDSVEDGSLSLQVGPITVNNYTPATGDSGLYARRAHTRFSYWQVEDAL